MHVATYFDGRTARAHAVELTADDELLVLRGEADVRYPAATTRLAEPFEHGPLTLYFGDGARCEVADPEAGPVLRAVLGYRASRVVRLTQYTWAALVALGLLVALILVTIIWGVPAASARIAEALPPSVDKTLGESTLKALQASRTLQETRLSDAWLAEVHAALARVAPRDVPVRLLVRKSDALGANAIALPDGSIVVSDLMVRLIAGKAGEFGEVQKAQLAGLLAHEIGHVRMRHGTRILASSSLSAALGASLFGDFSTVGTLPAVFAGMSYSREMEMEADEYAIAQLRQRGISTLPLADLLEQMNEGGYEGDEAEDDKEMAHKQHEAPARLWEAAVNFMSTHPATAERAARLRAAARTDGA